MTGRLPGTLATHDHCRDCGQPVTLTEDEWLGPDGAGCAGRGAWGEVWPHRPRLVEVARDTFKAVTETACGNCGAPITQEGALWVHDGFQIACSPSHFAGDGPWWDQESRSRAAIDAYTGPKACRP